MRPIPRVRHLRQAVNALGCEASSSREKAISGPRSVDRREKSLLSVLRSVLAYLTPGIAMVCLAVVSNVAAAEVLLEKESVTIFGEVRDTDARAIRQIEQVSVTVSLDSEGGELNAAIDIGRHIRSKGWNTTVEAGVTCLSACSLIYIAGLSRSNEGTVGLHRPYLAGPPGSRDQVREAAAEMLAAVRSYVQEMGVTEEFANIMVNTPPESVRLFPGTSIEALVPRVAPVYDELVAAEVARIHGATTEEYRRRLGEAATACGLRHHEERDVCIGAVLWGLSEPVFRLRADVARATCPQRAGAEDAPWLERPVDEDWEQCQRATMRGSLNLKRVEWPLYSGLTRRQVLDNLRARGIEPYLVDEEAIWFKDRVQGIPVHGGYRFDDAGRVGYSYWTFMDSSAEMLWTVNAVLSLSYGEGINLSEERAWTYQFKKNNINALPRPK